MINPTIDKKLEAHKEICQDVFELKYSWIDSLELEISVVRQGRLYEIVYTFLLRTGGYNFLNCETFLTQGEEWPSPNEVWKIFGNMFKKVSHMRNEAYGYNP